MLDESWLVGGAAWSRAHNQPSLMRTSFILLQRTDWLLEEKKETKKSCAESKVKSVEVRFLFCFLAPWLEVRLFVHISTIFILSFFFIPFPSYFSISRSWPRQRRRLEEKNPIVWEKLDEQQKKINKEWTWSSSLLSSSDDVFDGRSLLAWLPSLSKTAVFFFRHP